MSLGQFVGWGQISFRIDSLTTCALTPVLGQGGPAFSHKTRSTGLLMDQYDFRLLTELRSLLQECLDLIGRSATDARNSYAFRI